MSDRDNKTGWVPPGTYDKDGNIKASAVNAQANVIIAVLIIGGIAAIIGVLWLIGTVLGDPGCFGDYAADCIEARQ